ncbi:2-hydroxyglutaryl-CoA dehydratase [Zhengella mangrovi]|uniref:2-hydroxyglutaryl-CoA dehydratase n=1 Tax=Zhengella mangrovi TaxID=1982044 RepID=A0A2G1QJE4_9HYPH|nr:2-hydroxyglutaryl-CoA dehydratase [Zhengella mangrovi]PHP65653.1 2-hydroxyglutaryl-CoA dehydratase [Zhengella mangrovi]
MNQRPELRQFVEPDDGVHGRVPGARSDASARPVLPDLSAGPSCQSCAGEAKAAPRHWFDANPQGFTRAQREHTTLLFGGLTQSQDILIGGALEGLGYKVRVLDTPDNDALRFGKEFGNRGQCNPTYFTVGNLIKYLRDLEGKGLSRQEIIDNYVFTTVGACGPCRFGTYATEYRKALRDAGYTGFRVLLLDNNGGLRQACGDDVGLVLDRVFIFALIKAVMIGDILNVMAYRMRPYEVTPGATDQAVEACRKILREALSSGRNSLRAMRRCRTVLDTVELDWMRAKPKVSIIGEFWAMTTEGDGCYHLQRFLEQEGAEVDGQMVMAWVMYQVWQNRWDTRRRMMLRKSDHARMGLGDKDERKRLVQLWIAEKALKAAFHTYAWAIGLRHARLPDMDEMAELSNRFYDNHIRGGEGHMEVGKLIQTALYRKAHMVISIKPFGCMPSSGISDGIQSQVSELYPDAVFCAVETTGDAAVLLHSRVQMQLFKAREMARSEFARACEETGLDADEARLRLKRAGLNSVSGYRWRKRTAATAVAQLHAVSGGWMKRPLAATRRLLQTQPIS